jgi:hypothetical protein
LGEREVGEKEVIQEIVLSSQGKELSLSKL